MKMRRFVTILAAFCMLPFLAGAGIPPAKVDGYVKLSSAYIWRGEQVCGIHFNPGVAVNVGRLRLENYDFLAADGSYKEIDWDLSYNLGDFTFHIADYYYQYPLSGAQENYFSWEKGSGTHVDELVLDYSPRSIPIRAVWFTFFWGRWIPDNDGLPGRNSFESFLEMQAWCPAGEHGRFTAILGTSVFKGAYTGYREAFMPVHAAVSYTHLVPVTTGLSIPIEASVVWNPYTHACYAGASIGVRF